MQNRFSNQGGEQPEVISVLLVDDIAETRENIKKLLAFEEQEFKVVGSVGTGREALKIAMETRPDIVIMDINMPDMDGIQATAEITKMLPTAAVIMMSVQTDSDYLKKAMQAGARYFLGKPVDPDELYGTIRSVYRSYDPIRRQQRAMMEMPLEQATRKAAGSDDGATRGGNVIVVYGPSGGSGATTIATNLASGLMRKGIKVLLVDADLQFGDVGVFLKLQSQSTLLDLVNKVDDLDTDFFDSVVSTHESGMKVLLGPARPELADEVTDQTAVARIIEKVASNYDFIIVDTARRFDENLLSLTDVATKIVLVTTPTLAGVKNTRFVLDLFDKLSYAPDRTVLVLNRHEDERARNRVTIPTEAIERHLKRKVEAKIPNNEQVILSAVLKGVPVINPALYKDKSKAPSPVKELWELSDHLFNMLMSGRQDEDEKDRKEEGKRSGLGLRLGRS
ncbi:response regulator [Anaerolineae bacterium CFX9]|nr:response regulator [Kamptonema cortianum]MDL1899377.1 response regulator [Anaerolineae bacterium CFX9]